MPDRNAPETAADFPFSSRLPQWLLGAVLVVAVFLAYQPAWHAGFIWDDDVHITANPCVVGPLGVKEIWTTSAAAYYPLVETTFWAEHAVWGLNPMFFHLMNIAAQCACGLALWGVLRALRAPGAWFAAAIWALHPVQVESVAWVTELKNTQSCFFYLLAIWFFLRWRSVETFATRQGAPSDGRPTGTSGAASYALTLLCAILAMTSKTSTVMLPVVLALLWWWADRTWRWRNLRPLAPFFLLSIVASLWTLWHQAYRYGARGPMWTQSFGERTAISGKAVWFYLGKLLWPHPLIFIYPRWAIDPTDWRSYLPASALGVAAGLLWWKRNSWPRPLFFCLGYYVVSLFPMLDFFKGYFWRYSFVGDHFQYLASLGPLALAGVAMAWALGRARRPLLNQILCGALLLTLATLTWAQCWTYLSSETLWRTTIDQNPRCPMARDNLAKILMQKGETDEACLQLQESLRLDPNDAVAHYDYGGVLLQLGRLDDAVKQFQAAIALQPDFAYAYNNLGAALLKKGQVGPAIVQYQQAAKLRPNDAEIQCSLGEALLKDGRMAEAMSQFQKALAIQPQYARARQGFAKAQGIEGSAP